MANKNRLIDANALLEELDKFANPMPNKSGYDFLCGVASAITEIENAPTVDAVEVVRGHWDFYKGYALCSKCGCGVEEKAACSYDFCPYCGANMYGEKTDE